MSMSNNVGYSSLKRKAGLHNWAFMPSKDELEDDIGGLDLDDFNEQDLFSTEEVLQQNDHGEYFALQNYEE